MENSLRMSCSHQSPSSCVMFSAPVMWPILHADVDACSPSLKAARTDDTSVPHRPSSSCCECQQPQIM